jgi:hypothetical protein
LTVLKVVTVAVRKAQGDPLACRRWHPFGGGQETPFRSTVSSFWLDSVVIILLFLSDVRLDIDVACAGTEFVWILLN